MKHFLSALLLTGASVLVPALAFAQDKPVLNTAPPGATPAPTQTPAPQPQQPTTAPTYTPPAPPATPQPTPDRPSGLDLPSNRDAQVAGARSAVSSKLFLYTGFNLGYSSYNGYSQFNIGASPAIGYRLNDRVAVGPGISYNYNNYSFGRGYPSIGTSNIGGKVFAQVRVIDQFFLHGEYEVTRAQLLEVDPNGYLTGGKVNRTVETPLAGVGYRNQIGEHAAADIVLLYNFNDNLNSIYANPVIRFNFLFDLGRR